MDKHRLFHGLLAGLAGAVLLPGAPAGATAQRTFVASYGTDAAPCSISQPCRSFTAAVTNATAAGEVLVLDSAGYGPVTIGKSISIVAPRGVHAGIAIAGGAIGVFISTAGVDVLLRGLTINGDDTSSDGVYFGQGLQLTIEDCEISNVGGTGIHVLAAGGTVRVKDTVLRNNQQSGFLASGSTIVAALDHVHAYYNYPDGVAAYAGARVTVSDSVLAHSVAGVYSFSNFAVTSVTVTRSVVTGCAVGLWAATHAGGTARIVSDANILDQVDKAYLWEQGGGTEIIFSPGNNTVGFNNGIVSGGTLAPLSQH